jgi:hypothetical protein
MFPRKLGGTIGRTIAGRFPDRRAEMSSLASHFDIAASSSALGSGSDRCVCQRHDHPELL